jgi:hypothetical protein
MPLVRWNKNFTKLTKILIENLNKFYFISFTLSGLQLVLLAYINAV